MLYLVTNRKLTKKNTLINVIEEAIHGGIDAIILREKDLSEEELLQLALQIKKKVEGTYVKLIINGSIKIAKEVKAHGFHTGVSNLGIDKQSFNGLYGVSVHNVDEARLAIAYEADYLILGHIFETSCKAGLQPNGIKLIREIKAITSIPIIGIGGINCNNASEVLKAGANGIAIMSGIMEAENPYAAAVRYREVIKTVN